MLRAKGFLLLLAVTALVAAGAALILDREPALPEAGTLVFPQLLDRVNDVARIEVVSGGERFELERGEGGWSAPSRHGYPLDGDKVHELIVGTAGLARLEPKTANPERFDELGLRDPQQADSRAVGLTLLDAGGGELARLIVGERRPAKGDPTRTEYFVRVPGEERSWLVVGNLPADADEVVEWLDRRIVAVEDARIARVRATHPDGVVVTAEREQPGRGDFAYAELPEGAELDGIWRINDIGRVLTDLRLDDVRPAAAAEAAARAVQVVAETFDGLRVRMDVRGSQDEPLVLLGAEYDESLRRPQAQEDTGAQDDTAAPEVPSPEEVREEVGALNARWQGWAYVIPGYKFDYVVRRPEELVKKSEPGEQEQSQPERAPDASAPRAPGGDAPAADAPETDAPASRAPAGDAPAGGAGAASGG